jgi:hypothetical protein
MKMTEIIPACLAIAWSLAPLPAAAALAKGGQASTITAKVTEADIQALANGIVYSGAADVGDYGGEWFYRQSYYRLKGLTVDLLDGDKVKVGADVQIQWNTNLSVIQLDGNESAGATVVLRHPFRIVKEEYAMTLNLCLDDVESVSSYGPAPVKWFYNVDTTIRKMFQRAGCLKLGNLSEQLPLVPAELMRTPPTVTAYADHLELAYTIRHYPPFNLTPILGLLLN